MALSQPHGGASIDAGPRDPGPIRQRMGVEESARTQLRQWIHPVTGAPFAGRAVHVHLVPDALHAEPVEAAYVRGRGSAVCVRVDEQVRDNDCAAIPTN